LNDEEETGRSDYHFRYLSSLSYNFIARLTAELISVIELHWLIEFVE
jgi:hypothetical protein